MSLVKNTKVVLRWTNEQDAVISVICHCGEAFGIDELDKARRHVDTHIPGEERGHDPGP